MTMWNVTRPIGQCVNCDRTKALNSLGWCEDCEHIRYMSGGDGSIADSQDVEPPRADTDCQCSTGDCPCEGDAAGICACCRAGDHNGSCDLP